MEQQPENKTQKIARIALFGAVLVGIVVWQQGLLKDIFPKSAKSGTATSLLSSEDEALSSKIDPFIECLNRVDTALRKNYEEYQRTFEHHSTKSDQNGMKFHSFSSFKVAVYETNNQFSRECADNIDAAIKKSPADAVLDKSGAVYSATLRELIPVMNEIDSYYSQENYRDDDMKKGKELNDQLNPKLEKLFAASNEIHEAVDAHSLVLRKNELTAMEKENGRDFEWHTVNLAYHARITLDAINKLVETETLTLEALAPLEKDYEKAFTDAKTYASENPDTKTSLGNKPRWFSLDRNFENILGAVRTLRRNLNEKKEVHIINGDLERVSREYNSMIRSYNMNARLAR